MSEEVARSVVTLNLPKEGNEYYGLWLGYKPKADVHAYLTNLNDGSFVMGHNENTDNMEFTPLCIVFEKDGDVHVQYKDASGQPALQKVSPYVVVQKYLEFLEAVKTEALAEKS